MGYLARCGSFSLLWITQSVVDYVGHLARCPGDVVGHLVLCESRCGPPSPPRSLSLNIMVTSLLLVFHRKLSFFSSALLDEQHIAQCRKRPGCCGLRGHVLQRMYTVTVCNCKDEN